MSARFADLPACLVCGDFQVPRRIAVVGDNSGLPIASLCNDAGWCQTRAAGRALEGLSLGLRLELKQACCTSTEDKGVCVCEEA